MDTKSWTIYSCHCWLVAQFSNNSTASWIQVQAFCLFDPKLYWSSIFETPWQVLCIEKREIPCKVSYLGLIFKGDRGCCCPIFLYFPSLYTLCCIGVVLNIRIVIFVLFSLTVILQLSYTYKLFYLSYRIKGWLNICVTLYENIIIFHRNQTWQYRHSKWNVFLTG